MIGIPILTGLALGAALLRSRRDPLVVLTTLLATVALFLTTSTSGTSTTSRCCSCWR